MTDEGCIKFSRAFLKWEWYDDTNMVRLFLHLLLKAASTAENWHGIKVKRGQVVTSIRTLADQTKLSVRNVRTCMQRLTDAHEIDTQVTHLNTIVTICKYDSYSVCENVADKETTQQRHSERHSEKEENEEKEIRKKEPKKEIKKEEVKEEKRSLQLANARDTGVCVREGDGGMSGQTGADGVVRFLGWLGVNCPYLAGHLTMPTAEQFEKLKATYGSQEIASTCLQIENRLDLRRRYKSLYLTLNNWLKREKERRELQLNQRTNNDGEIQRQRRANDAAALIERILAEG